jgi:exopolysaccharide biosynthesis polyprenyl glycosylphosphotransferase
MNNWVPILITACADSLALAAAGWIGYTIRTSSIFPESKYIQNPGQYLLLLVFALIIWHISVFSSGGYKQKPAIFKIDELLFHFKTSIILLVILMAATFLYKKYDYSRLILFFSWVTLVFTGNIFRQISYRFKGWLHENGIATKTACLTGNSEVSDFLRNRILNNPSCGLKIVEKPEEVETSTFVAQNEISELFLISDKVDYQTIWKIREASVNQGLRIHLVPSIGNLYLRNLQGLFFDGTVLISLDSPEDKKLHLFLKRIFDLIFSSFWLIIASPLFLLLGALIKIDSSGPVIFRQKRIGLNNEPFEIFKFRTMRQDAAIYAETPRDRTDPRITRIGSLLRATGLDELPQLFNVLLGQMSIVGPRPEMPFIVEKYNELEKKRLKAKPGITGLWQVYARSENLPIHHHIEYDLFYIENFSIMLDFIIILDTIPTAILRTGI